MNLIEKLGLEKCKAIVDGAPEITTGYIEGADILAYVKDKEFSTYVKKLIREDMRK